MRHEWTDPDTLGACVVEGDPLVGHPDLTVNGQSRAAVFAAREILRLAERVRELERRDLRSFDQIGADRLADEVAVLVTRGVLDSRSAVADALLDYREKPRTERSDRLAALEEENLALRSRVIEAEESAETDRQTSNSVFERVEQLAKENQRLREVLSPLAPLFAERASAWERMKASADCGEMAPAITLTAEFSTEGLRALAR